MPRERKWYSVRWWEFIVIFLILCLAADLLLPPIEVTWSASQRGHCQDNLKQLGMAFLMYAREDPQGRYPRMHGYESFGAASNAPGCVNVHDDFDFGPDMRVLYPNYIDDPLLLVCPSGPYSTKPTLLWGRFQIGSLGYARGAVDAAGIVRDDGTGTCQYVGRMTNGDVDYTYLPWVVGVGTPGFRDNPTITEEAATRAGLPLGGPASLVAVAARIRQAQSLDPADSAALLDADIDLTEMFGSLGDTYTHSGCATDRERQTVLRRVSLSVERDLLNPAASSAGAELIAQATIPLLFDRVFSSLQTFGHIPGGSNVLYLDGHVQFIKYPKQFPVCEAWAHVIAALE